MAGLLLAGSPPYNSTFFCDHNTTGSCYLYQSTTRTWQNARAACQLYSGGDLVTYQSYEEQSTVCSVWGAQNGCMRAAC